MGLTVPGLAGVQSVLLLPRHLTQQHLSGSKMTLARAVSMLS